MIDKLPSGTTIEDWVNAFYGSRSRKKNFNHPETWDFFNHEDIEYFINSTRPKYIMTSKAS